MRTVTAVVTRTSKHTFSVEVNGVYVGSITESGREWIGHPKAGKRLVRKSKEACVTSVVKRAWRMID